MRTEGDDNLHVPLRNALLIILLLTVVVAGQDKGSRNAGKTSNPETSHFSFVKEYVREMGEDEDLNGTAEKELSQSKTTDEQFSTGIYVSKSAQLELRSQIRMLKIMRLDSPYETLIPSLIDFYQREIDLHQRLLEISTKFLNGPKPGVDYQTLAAEMPQLRAELEATQKAVFETTPLVFMTLIDPRPDSKNHVSHLVITKEEKSELQSDLEIILKGQSEQRDHDYYISAAMVLRGAFLKGHKCSDEAWD